MDFGEVSRIFPIQGLNRYGQVHGDRSHWSQFLEHVDSIEATMGATAGNLLMLKNILMEDDFCNDYFDLEYRLPTRYISRGIYDALFYRLNKRVCL
jgi:hypothetical protein